MRKIGLYRILVIAAALGLFASLTSATEMVRASAGNPVAFDWAEDLRKMLEEMIRELEEAGEKTGADGTLDDTTRAAILNDLSAAVNKADGALTLLMPDGDQLGDFGSILSTNPQTLSEYAAVTIDLATAAESAVAGNPDFNRDEVASYVKTVRHLITRSSPHSYQSLVENAPEPAGPGSGLLAL